MSEKEYLTKTIWHIYAYMELGFVYDDGKELFETIMSYFDITLDNLFPNQQWNCRNVVLNRC